MKNLLAVLVILALSPLMAAGFLFEFARFGVSCGRDVAEELFNFVFTKGGV